MQKIIARSLFLVGLNAQAQEASTHTSLELPEMVVTATRTAVAHNQLSAAATVYTRQDIERLQVKSVPELLRSAPGIMMTQSGGIGKTTSLFMRGTNSDHVLVLIDGIKVGSATLGTSPFELMPIDQIDRVEIIRGPQSSLYGSEAIGGVIQIFTRKGADSEKPGVSLDAGVGSYDAYRAAGSVSGKWQNNWYSLGASSIGTEGINARRSIPGKTQYDTDRDGYQNTAMNVRAGHRFDNNAEIEAFFIRAEGTNEYDSSYGGDHMAFINQTVGVSGNTDIVDNWHSTLRLGQSRDENDNFLPTNAFDSRFNTTRWNASWLNEFTLSDAHKLILGSDYRLDEVDSSTAFLKTSRYDVGVFTEYRGQILAKHFINASVRYDNNEAFGDYVSSNVGWRFNWDYGISTFANFGNAFKAPSFNDLYYPGQVINEPYGNPHLRPEQSTSFEAGLAGSHEWWQWEVRAYHTNIDNLITPTPYPESINYSYYAANVGKSQIDGLEGEIGTQILGWNSKLTMGIMNPEIRDTNKRLPRRPDKTLSFDVSRSFGSIDVGANVLAQDHRFDNPANTTKVAGFVTLDLRAAYHVSKNWMFSAKLSNLLDRDYQTVSTYNTEGRNFFFSIHYNN